ncbi:MULTISPECIES: hypothetical protein [unclassified Haladaptatus]|uniref:hypothetical protein n=1 Tax=unclassified Haladaptatus TaxID=2622732 RepID=UPI00209C2331|nr:MULTISPECIES: hypothetical protein [unclassified Haladaptatus]MCO8242914.1 hypothetical protein [Haladaptatus sp. AB643]MCO8252671.1 hypothetical protein [Haladaptatus sp. AB618]
MDDTRARRLARYLSVLLVLLGAVFVGFSVLTDDSVDIVLGVVVVLSGVISLRFFRVADSDIEFDLTESPSFVVNVFQLVLVLVVFVLLAYLIDDLENVVRLLDTGVPSLTFVAVVGILIGLVLGGAVPVLMQRIDAIGKEMSDSRSARTVGFSFTFGTFVLLLVLQPAASTLYAIAYTVSRIGVLVGAYALPRL